VPWAARRVTTWCSARATRATPTVPLRDGRLAARVRRPRRAQGEGACCVSRTEGASCDSRAEPSVSCGWCHQKWPPEEDKEENPGGSTESRRDWTPEGERKRLRRGCPASPRRPASSLAFPALRRGPQGLSQRGRGSGDPQGHAHADRRGRQAQARHAHETGTGACLAARPLGA
jgi:hypothetical protein